MTKAPFLIRFFTLIFASLLLTPAISLDPYTEPPAALTLDCSDHNDPFYYQGTGDARIRISEGQPPYAVSWQGPVSGSGTLDTSGVFRIDSLPAGSYTVAVEAADGGMETCSFVLDEVDCGNLRLDIFSAPTQCTGTSTGTLALSFGSSNSDVQFDWSGRALRPVELFGFTAEGIVLGSAEMPAGTYSVTISDTRGCELIDSITVEEAPELLLNCGTPRLPSSPGSQDGQIAPELSGGELPYTLSWTGPVGGSMEIVDPSGFTIDNLPEGIYELQLTDHNGCTAFCSINLDNPAGCESFRIDLTATSPECHGESNAAIKVGIKEGTPPYIFDWSHDQYNSEGISGDLSDIPAGTYQLTVTDAGNCQTSQSIEVVDPPMLSMYCGCQNFPTRPDTADGAFHVYLNSPPVRPYTITYSDGTNMISKELNPPVANEVYQIFEVPVGYYGITVTDGNGCQATCSVDMNIPECEEDFAYSLDNTYTGCFGESKGKIGIGLKQGNREDYTFDWANDAYDGQDSIFNLSAGWYPVTVTAPDGCVDINSFVVVDPPPLILLCSQTTPPSILNGADGMNEVQLLGGAPPYQLSWTGPVSGSASGLLNGTFEITDLEAGAYTILMEDNYGCTTDCTFFISEPLPDCTIDLVCRENDPGEGQGTGRYSFAIAGGTPRYDLQLVGPVNFNSNLDADGTWESEILPAGDWTFRVVDADGCIQSCTFTVADAPCTGPPELHAGFGRTICQTSCEEFPLSLSGEGPFLLEYSIFQNGQLQQFQQSVSTEEYLLSICPEELFLQPGSFLLNFNRLADQHCTSELGLVRSFTVLESPVSVLQINSCIQDSVVIENTVFTPSSPSGTIVLPNAAANGCDSLLSVSVIYFTEAELLEKTLCRGDSLLVGGEVFNEEHPGGTVTVTNPETGFCEKVIEVRLTLLERASSYLKQTLCYGESLWIGEEEFNKDRPSGTVSLFTGRACDSLVHVELEFLPEQTARISGDTVVCENTTIDIALEVSGGATYSYELSSTTGESFSGSNRQGTTVLSQNIRSSQNFVLQTVLTDSGCPVTVLKRSATVSISQPILDLEPDEAYNGFGLSCPESSDGILYANVRRGVAPYSFHWSTGETTERIEQLSAGNYALTITDQIGCSAEAEIELVAPPPMEIIAQGISEGCSEEALHLIRIEQIAGGADPYAYSFDQAAFHPINATPFTTEPLEEAGIHTLYLVDANGCRIDTTVLIPEAEILTLDLGPDQTIQLGDSVLLQPLTNFAPAQWAWNTDAGLDNPADWTTYASPSQNTGYTLSVTSENGCVLADEVRILVDSRIPVYLPSAFSPNGDGVNDFFTVYTNAFVRQVVDLQVYDRWGNQVFARRQFSPNEPHLGWDGRYRGKLLSASTYLCRVELELQSGEKIQLSGEINLLR